MAPLYRTAPISVIPQPDFLNTVVIARLETVEGSRLADPRALLGHLKSLERESGRNGGPRFGPRTLDIDLLLFGDLILPALGGEPELVLPHPRMRQRRFVLAPLCDLRPDLRLPPDGAAARDLLAELGTEQAIEKIGWS